MARVKVITQKRKQKKKEPALQITKTPWSSAGQRCKVEEEGTPTTTTLWRRLPGSDELVPVPKMKTI
jgi:hypothetical protein